MSKSKRRVEVWKFEPPLFAFNISSDAGEKNCYKKNKLKSFLTFNLVGWIIGCFIRLATWRVISTEGLLFSLEASLKEFSTLCLGLTMSSFSIRLRGQFCDKF